MSLQRFKEMAHRGLTDFGISASRGDFALVSTVHKFGFNADVAGTEETVWDGGGLYTYPLSSQVMYVHSDNAGDAHDGSGARQLQFQGLDSSGEMITNVVTLNGTNVVSTAGQVMRTWRGIVLDAGNSATNIGNIYISTDVVSSNGFPTNVHLKILPGNAQTLMSLYTVPISHQVFMKSFNFTSGGNATTIINGKIWSRPLGQVFQIKEFHQFTRDAPVEIPMQAPTKYEALTDIEMRAKASTGTIDVSAGMELFKIAKDF